MDNHLRNLAQILTRSQPANQELEGKLQSLRRVASNRDAADRLVSEIRKLHRHAVMWSASLPVAAPDLGHLMGEAVFLSAQGESENSVISRLRARIEFDFALKGACLATNRHTTSLQRLRPTDRRWELFFAMKAARKLALAYDRTGHAADQATLEVLRLHYSLRWLRFDTLWGPSIGALVVLGTLVVGLLAAL